MSQGRILVVDDLPDWRTTLSGILLDEGYEVRVASNRQEALQLLEDERFHLAVLDVRLDEADENNREGLELMRQIKAQYPTVLVIILTGYADVSMVKDALQPQSHGLSLAYSFVEKTNSHELIEFIERAFQREVRINWALTIHLDDNFRQSLLDRLRFTDQPKPPTNQLSAELDELLGKLFFTCEEITLYPLEYGYSRAVVFRVKPLYQHRGQGESVVVKLGEWSLIKQEEYNFSQAVQGAVGGHRLPQRLELTRTRSLGGLVYSFAGLGNTAGFVEFYTKASPAKIALALENLFLETCFPWGRHKKVFRSTFNFTEHYFSHLHLTPTELRYSLTSLFSEQSCLSQIDSSGSRLRFLEDTLLVNPVEFVLGNPLIDPAYLTLVHGDLTGYNVILDHHHETWLIDFAKTGQGHLLQDFASFENFIKFSHLDFGEPRSFYEWERELINSLTLQPPSRLLDLTPPDQFSKAHQTVLVIRRLAYRVSSDKHLIEYLINLLFHALKLITIMNLKPIQRELAVVTAALICERLTSNSSK